VTNIPSLSQLGPAFRESHPPFRGGDAIAEAEACLQCGGPCAAAPCVRSCPAGIDIPGFIKDIAESRPLDAARKIFADNILGGTCARVCPVEVLCEGSCVLLKEGRHPIQIGRLQRHATDAALAANAPVTPKCETPRRPESVAVIGAGPAGLACAAELARLGFGVTIYEARDFPGGLITRGIAPYKQQYEPVPQEVEQIRAMGVQIRYNARIGADISVEQLNKDHRAIFLGVGMGDDMPARIPGEDLPGVWESLRFIETLKLQASRGAGVGKRVAVIGGGNTAIDVAREVAMMRAAEIAASNTAVDVARQAVKLGADEVMMLYRRSEAEMPAFPHEIAAAKREGVQIIPLVAPVEFVGEGKVTGVKCVRMRLGAPDASGRPRPEPIPGSEFVLAVDTAIKAIGQKPHTELLKLFGVEMSGSTVRSDQSGRTSIKGVYAGGDCINGGATVVQAVRDGKLAARAIAADLAGVPAVPSPAPAPTRVEPLDGTIRHFQADFRLTTAPKLCKGCNICVTGCPTHTLALDKSNHIQVVDPATCVFCGLCEARCPDFAIWIVKGEAQRARSVEPRKEPVA
jgi:glutamate synthase (NADPH/NADH) small chain